MKTLSSDIFSEVLASHSDVMIYYPPINMAEPDTTLSIPLLDSINKTNGAPRSRKYFCAISPILVSTHMNIYCSENVSESDLRNGGIYLKKGDGDTLVLTSTQQLNALGTPFESMVSLTRHIGEFFEDPSLEPMRMVGTRNISFDNPSNITELDGISEQGTKNVVLGLEKRVMDGVMEMKKRKERVALVYDPRIPICARFMGPAYPTLAGSKDITSSIFLLNASVFTMVSSGVYFLGVPAAPIIPGCIYDMHRRNMFRYEQMAAASIMLAAKSKVLPVTDIVNRIPFGALDRIEDLYEAMMDMLIEGAPLEESLASVSQIEFSAPLGEVAFDPDTFEPPHE